MITMLDLLFLPPIVAGLIIAVAYPRSVSWGKLIFFGLIELAVVGLMITGGDPRGLLWVVVLAPQSLALYAAVILFGRLLKLGTLVGNKQDYQVATTVPTSTDRNLRVLHYLVSVYGLFKLGESIWMLHFL